jgi:hypothetical protein
MRRPGRIHRVVGHSHEGSALLLVLFACLGVAIAVQTLTTVVLCAERALADESTGRLHAGQKDEGLAVVRGHMLGSWLPQPWTEVTAVPNEVQGRVRGRDGIDLPIAALVATRVVLGPNRVSPWLQVDEAAAGSPLDDVFSGGTARVHLVEAFVGPAPGDGCVVTQSGSEWRLDDGWRLVGRGLTAWGSGVLWMAAAPGETVSLPEECGGKNPDSPMLVVLSGGGDLDAREQGDLYGVLVVDGGSLLLEGTVLHGAAFVTDTVALGTSGSVRYSQRLLRWATDRSICRVRLVPGSRWESTE